MPAAPVLIRTTHDGRRIEVIGARICLDGQPEADELVVIDEHPNRQAILKLVPLAAFQRADDPDWQGEGWRALGAARTADRARGAGRRPVTAGGVAVVVTSVAIPRPGRRRRCRR